MSLLADLQHWIVENKGVLYTIAAGTAGGVVRTISLQERWPRALANMLVGGIAALYLTPVALPLLEPTLGRIVPDASSVNGFGGFVIGLGGIAITTFIVDVIEFRRAQLRREREKVDRDDA